MIVFLVVLIPIFFFMSGFMHIWITEGRSTFWRGISKKSIIEIFGLIREAKANGEDHKVMLKRFFIGYGAMILFAGICLLFVFGSK